MARAKKKSPSSLLEQNPRFNVATATILAVAAIVIGYFVVKIFAATGAATLSLSPSIQTLTNGQTFTVQIMENSGSATVNAVQANVSYPAASLSLQSIDTTGTAFPLVAQSTGANGVINIAQATNGGAPPVTGSQLVATLTFKSLMTSGSAMVAFTAGSAVVSSVDNTALALTTTGGAYAPDTISPTAPTGLHVTGTTGSSISLAWSPSADNVAVASYNVYSSGAKIGSVNASSSLTYTDSGLTQGTSHAYTVAAVDTSGNVSAQSTVVTQIVPDVTAPSVPGPPSATAPAYNQVKLTWGASTDTGGSGLVGYKIYRNGSAAALTLVAASTTTYTDASVNGSTTYTYQVSSYDGAGNESAKTTAVQVATPAPPDSTPPTTPGSLRASAATLTSITISWAASTDNIAVASYQVYRGATLIASPAAGTLSYTDTGLAPTTTYQYSVKAVDTSGNVSAAAVVSTATLALKPGDVNGDNHINVFDLSTLLSAWNTTGANLATDLNKDGTVNVFDLSILLSNWGK